MELPELAMDSCAVVVRGEFAPSAFSPAWLRDHDLISREDFDASVIELISPEGSTFRCGNLSIKVLRDALQVVTEETTEPERVRDLARGILALNPNTPIAALGINRHAHFKTTPDRFQEIGDLLAPKDHWSGLFSSCGLSDFALTGARDGLEGGAISVRVQPSNIIEGAIFVLVNDHYTLEYFQATPNVREASWFGETMRALNSTIEKNTIAVDILRDKWTESWSKSSQLITTVAHIGEK